MVAVTGADMPAKLDGPAVPLWQSVAVDAGQTLKLGPAKSGARAYIAIAGGIDTVPWLGSRSTFHKAGVGGLDGSALKKGSRIPVAYAAGTPGRSVKPDAGRPSRPTSTGRSRWWRDRTMTGSMRPARSVS